MKALNLMLLFFLIISNAHNKTPLPSWRELQSSSTGDVTVMSLFGEQIGCIS